MVANSLQNGSNMAPKFLQNGANMAAKWLQNGANMGAKSALEASWGPLGALERAWSAKGGLPRAYGALLDGSWGAIGAEKSTLERLLAAPREIPRQVSAILGAKRLPKGGPRGSKIEAKRRPELKTRFLQKPLNFQWILMIFEVQGALFGGQNR